VPHLAGLVQDNPFAAADLAGVQGLNATFLDPESSARLALPLTSAQNEVEVLHITPYVVLSLSRTVGAKTGYPTPFLEKLLQAQVTTRGWPTIERLVKKFG
jgi:hypothetical protein